MEIIISSHSFDTEFGDDNRNSILKDIESELRQLNTAYSIENANIGRGADFPGILVTIAGILFAIKEFNDNLDSLVSLAKKIKNIIFEIKKFASIRIDKEGALFITLESIASYTPAGVESIKLVLSEVINGDPLPWGKSGSIYQFPEALYLNVIEADDELFISVVRSDGNIEVFKKVSGLSWFNFR